MCVSVYVLHVYVYILLYNYWERARMCVCVCILLLVLNVESTANMIHLFTQTLPQLCFLNNNFLPSEVPLKQTFQSIYLFLFFLFFLRLLYIILFNATNKTHSTWIDWKWLRSVCGILAALIQIRKKIIFDLYLFAYQIWSKIVDFSSFTLLQA